MFTVNHDEIGAIAPYKVRGNYCMSISMPEWNLITGFFPIRKKRTAAAAKLDDTSTSTSVMPKRARYSGTKRPMRRYRPGRVGKSKGATSPLGRWFKPSNDINPISVAKWQYLVIGGEIQGGSVTNLTYDYIRGVVNNQVGFIPSCYRIHGFRAWWRSGTTPGTQIPTLRATIVNNQGADISEALDYGDLSIPAKLGYTYGTADQAHTFTDVTAGGTLIAKIEGTTGGGGTIQIMLSYYGKQD